MTLLYIHETYLHTNIVLRIMTYQVCKNANIFTHTHIDIYLILHKFTFQMHTFVNTLAYFIHKHTQIHLTIGSTFSIWSVPVIFVFGRYRRIYDEWQIKHKCRCRFKDGARKCGIVLHINHTWCNNGSIYQSHVMDLPHTVIFTKNMSIINKEPTSPTHSNLIRSHLA